MRLVDCEMNGLLQKPAQNMPSELVGRCLQCPIQGKPLVITIAHILLPPKAVSSEEFASPANDCRLKNSRVTTKFGLFLAMYYFGGRLLYAKLKLK